MFTGFSSQGISGSSRMGDHSWVLEYLFHFAMWPARQSVTDWLWSFSWNHPGGWLPSHFVGRRDVEGLRWVVLPSLPRLLPCLWVRRIFLPFVEYSSRASEGKMTILLVYAVVSPDTWCCEYGLETCPVESYIIDGLHKGDDRKWLLWIQRSWLSWNMHYREQGEVWSLSVIVTFILVFKSQGLWRQAS